MRKIFFIPVMVAFLFIIEFALFNFVAPWLRPNLLLLFMIFISLYLGIRYALYTAVLSGLLRDCFHSNVFGIYLLSFVLCAYLATVFGQYFYHTGSRSARILLVLSITLTYVVAQYIFNLMFSPLNFWFMMKHILIPEVLATLAVTSFMFTQLKKCVLRLSV